MTVQRAFFKFDPGITAPAGIEKIACLLMTINNLENVYGKFGLSIYFPRRFSKKFLKKIKHINLCPWPFIEVRITTTSVNPYYRYVENWEDVAKILDLLNVSYKNIPTTCISQNYEINRR